MFAVMSTRGRGSPPPGNPLPPRSDAAWASDQGWATWARYAVLVIVMRVPWVAGGYGIFMMFHHNMK
jgi:hypothetical protein